jgi:hypothetical protein
MTTPHSWVGRTLMVPVMFGFAVGWGLAADKTSAGEITEDLSPLQAPLQSMTGDELFARLLEHNRLRDVRLQRYSAIRSYDVANDNGKVYAEELVREEYRAPDHKTFVTKSEKGSPLVRDLVLNRLIASESEAASGRAHRDSSLKPANYEFSLLGEQDVGPYHCLVVEALPKRRDKYLFEGKVWSDATDYAIVRIAGQPAKSLSFWITRADFVRQYQKIGDFWLPAKDETNVHMRLYGKKILTIDHMDYAINEGAGGSAQDGTTENRTNER